MDIIQEHIDLLRAQFDILQRMHGTVRRYRAGRNCQKGYNCGGSCITRRKNCRKALEGEAKSFSEWMVAKMSAGIPAVVGEAPVDRGEAANPALQKLNEIPTYESRPRTKKERRALNETYTSLINEVDAAVGSDPEVQRDLGRARGRLLSMTNNSMTDAMYQRDQAYVKENIAKAAQKMQPGAVIPSVTPDPAPPPAPIDLNAERKKRRPTQQSQSGAGSRTEPVNYAEVKPSPFNERTNYPAYIEERYKELDRIKKEEMAALPKTKREIAKLYPNEIPPDAIRERPGGGYSIEYPEPKQIYRNGQPYSKQWRSSGESLQEALYQWEVDLGKREDPWRRTLGETKRKNAANIAPPSIQSRIDTIRQKLSTLALTH